MAKLSLDDIPMRSAFDRQLFIEKALYKVLKNGPITLTPEEIHSVSDSEMVIERDEAGNQLRVQLVPIQRSSR